MKTKKFLVPSLLAFPSKQWTNVLPLFIEQKIKYVHFDVMDINYVGNVAYNEQDYLQLIQHDYDLKVHVHLMVLDPLNEINKYFAKQTDSICFHFDVYNKNDDVIKCLNLIKQQNIKAGIAINPNFQISDYQHFLPYCDIITIMGVYPGKGGQSFEQSCINNLNAIKNWAGQNKHLLEIEIDGGINLDTIKYVLKNSNYLVMGSFLANNLDKIMQIKNTINH